MPNEYKLSDVLTQKQFEEMREIVRCASAVKRPPHAGLMNYINARPEIVQKCGVMGLLPEFFAYQFEALNSR